MPPMAENPFENLLTAKDIAQELGLSSPYVSTLLAGGAMPVLRHNGRVFVRRDDFETFVRSRRPRAKFIRGLSPATVEALRVLVEWREARVIELAIGLDRAPGNVRKHVTLLNHAGYIERGSEPGVWTPTIEGDAFAADPATNAALAGRPTPPALTEKDFAVSA